MVKIVQRKKHSFLYGLATKRLSGQGEAIRQRESLSRSSVANESFARILRWLVVVIDVCLFLCLWIVGKELLTSEGHYVRPIV